MHMMYSKFAKIPVQTIAPALMAAGTLFTPLFAHAQSPEFAARLVAESIANRESGERGTYHAVVRVEVEGPATALVVPGNQKGNSYKQLNVQEWWADDQKIAVATHHESSSWLDGKLISTVGAKDVPRFVYSFDGERAYLLDFRADGRRLLEINARWPFAGSAQPVLFGRAYANIPLSECTSGPFEIVRAEPFEGHPCQVVQFPFGRGKVNSWLATDLAYLALREEFIGDGESRLSREFTFADGASGVRAPVSGVEVAHAPSRGDVTTTWTFTGFEVNPTLPPYLFSPGLDDADIVVDRSTGKTLKGADGTDETK